MPSLRRERIHVSGGSNRKALTAHVGRPAVKKLEQPIDFDASMRSTLPELYRHGLSSGVPLTQLGAQGSRGNTDFGNTLAGCGYRKGETFEDLQQMSRRSDNAHGSKATEGGENVEGCTSFGDALESRFSQQGTGGQPLFAETILARDSGFGSRNTPPPSKQSQMERSKRSKQLPPVLAPDRYNARHWFKPLDCLKKVQQKRHPYDTWNSEDSKNLPATRKGVDRLMRACRSQAEAEVSPDFEGFAADINEREEYYPRRELIEQIHAVDNSDDCQVRPIYLTDFVYSPREKTFTDEQMVERMKRIRGVLKQRYRSKKGLVRVFKNYSLIKEGYIFPPDMKQVLAHMGIKVTDRESELLVQAVDKTERGGINYEEFADLIFSDFVEVGKGGEDAQQRFVHNVTRKIIDDLADKTEKLSRAFCEVDPNRDYSISKEQFTTAVSSVCEQFSPAVLESLYVSQWLARQADRAEAAQDGSDTVEEEPYPESIDWPQFMQTLSQYVQNQQPITPCHLQPRKRHYDLLQRSAAVTGGIAWPVDLNQEEHDEGKELKMVADHLRWRGSKLKWMPLEAKFFTCHYVDFVRSRARIGRRAIANNILKSRMKELFGDVDKVPREDVVKVIWEELRRPGSLTEPYKGSEWVMAKCRGFVPQESDSSSSSEEQEAEGFKKTLAGPTIGEIQNKRADLGEHDQMRNAHIRCKYGDVQAFVGLEVDNREGQVSIKNLWRHLREDPINAEIELDAFSGHLRRLRPMRERPAKGEQVWLGGEEEAAAGVTEPETYEPYSNKYQALYVMEMLSDALTKYNNRGGGRLPAYKVFKGLDMDQDGYLTLSDMRKAFKKYKMSVTESDVHALFTHFDKTDRGSVSLNDFSQGWWIESGSFLNKLSRPMRSCYFDGGARVDREVEKEHGLGEVIINDGREMTEGEKQIALGLSLGASVEGGGSGSPASTRNDEQDAELEQCPLSQIPVVTITQENDYELKRKGVQTAPSSLYSSDVFLTEPQRYPKFFGKISEVIGARSALWRAQKHELWTTIPSTRSGYTVYPDTRHVTEPIAHSSIASYCCESDRFKTMNSSTTVFSVPDLSLPHVAEKLRKNASSEFRVERRRARQAEMEGRKLASEAAGYEFEEKRIARKARSQLNYERRVAAYG